MPEGKQLYLSRLILNPLNKEVQRDLADCQKLHCRLMTGFLDNLTAEEKEQLRVCYRIDFNPRLKRLSVLVQSHGKLPYCKPDWGKLPADYLADESNNSACQLADEKYKTLCDGMRLTFRLRANPTKRISKNNTEQDARWLGKRIELRREEDRIAWLQRKAEASGFRLLSVQLKPDVLNLQTATEAKTFGKHEKGRLSFGAAMFNGELEITDAEKFKQALADGIGSGKAYGFGLLSVAPAG